MNDPEYTNAVDMMRRRAECESDKFQPSHICPCCGAALVNREVTQTNGGFVQQCRQCHWESELLIKR